MRALLLVIVALVADLFDRPRAQPAYLQGAPDYRDRQYRRLFFGARDCGLGWREAHEIAYRAVGHDS